jgi:8-oxo-dGTP pyrophosphatase MutT (NUDIX family)
MIKSSQKVLAYITRRSSNKVELLVFVHRGMPEAGIQVPAGTVEAGENSEVAIIREVTEESGLQDIVIKYKIHSSKFFNEDKNETQQRDYFEMTAPPDTPNSWSYTVTVGKEDKGLVFDFFWIPLVEAEKRLAGNQGEAIPFVN